MTRASPERKRLPAVGAAERRSTALEAGAKPTYETKEGIGKRFRCPPDNTGNNRQRATAGANDSDARIWAWPKRGGEVRAELSLFNRKRFLNLRLWVSSPNGFIPTREGVTIPLEAIGELGDALSAYADANGLRAA